MGNALMGGVSGDMFFSPLSDILIPEAPTLSLTIIFDFE